MGVAGVATGAVTEADRQEKGSHVSAIVEAEVQATMMATIGRGEKDVGVRPKIDTMTSVDVPTVPREDTAVEKRVVVTEDDHIQVQRQTRLPLLVP